MLHGIWGKVVLGGLDPSMYTWLGVKILEGDLMSGKELLNVVLGDTACGSYTIHNCLRSWSPDGSHVKSDWGVN